MISSELKLVPMWPDQAPAIIPSVLMRASAAKARTRAPREAGAASSRWNSADRHEAQFERFALVGL